MAKQSRGKIIALIFLGLGMIAAIVATFIMYQVVTYYEERIAEESAPEPVEQVVIATRDLYMGMVISESDVEMVEVPPDFMPETSVTTLEEALNRTPIERILVNEFIREERLAAQGLTKLNAIIPRGMRALSVDIKDGRSVSGFILPGNYVDVLVTIMPTDRDQAPVTKTLLQAQRVLAVNSSLDGNAPEEESGQRIKPSVTLAVTAEDAQKLAHAQEEGIVTLTLRNDIDVTHQETHGTTAGALLGRGYRQKSAEVQQQVVQASGSTGSGDQGSTLTVIQGQDSQTLGVSGDGTVQAGNNRQRRRR